MVQGVYVDILLVINFLVDFLLLSLLARTGGQRQRRDRCFR